MINRYILQFRDAKLEEKYSEFQTEYKRKPLAKIMIIIGFIIIAISLPASVVDDNLNDLFVWCAYLIENICLLIIFLYRPKYIRWVFILVSYMLMFSYTKFDSGKNQFHYQIYAITILTSQFVIISTGEFLDALFSIIGIFSTYIAYYIKFEESFSYQYIVSLLVIGFLLMNSFYQHSLALRSQFQLTILEDQWDEIFFGTIKQPSIIFTFDLIKHSFVLKKQINFPYICNSTDELKLFLRSAQLFNNPKVCLETHLYNQLNDQNLAQIKQQNQELQINYKKNGHQLRYSIFQGASPIILVQIISTNLKINHEKIETLYQFKYLSLLKLLQIKIKDIYFARTNHFCDIIKILIYRHSLEKSRQTQSMEKFNLIQTLNKLKLIYTNKIISITCSPTFVVSYKNFLILILIEIFESIISNHIDIIIQSFKTENYLQVKVLGQYTEKTIENFQSRTQFLNENLLGIQTDEKSVTLQMRCNQRSLETEKSKFRNYPRYQ